MEAGWGIYDNGGWSRVSDNPGLYSNLGGSASALTAGGTAGWLIGSGATLFTANPVVGGMAGGLAGMIVGGAAYMGGEHAARSIMYGINLELVRVKEQEASETALKSIDMRLEALLSSE